ncbi:hypothetical protein GCM10023093_11460 [Nemorincola caseinilytica]|uniref:Uncharacterized protein n=1 Tax=Nemorincola caseinilytica TaxID=2054315 RepID=A0ABP8ND48_9BACT
MKKVFLFLALISVCNVASAQQEVFMQVLENKKVCNNEDELTYFLQTRSFERKNENHYYHSYAVGKEFYTTCIINTNTCYITYQTNNAKDYNSIKKAIEGMCTKELAADKTPCYICDQKRMHDVQVIFSGYSQESRNYEILVYQNPETHEPPYNQTDRVRPARK